MLTVIQIIEKNFEIPILPQFLFFKSKCMEIFFQVSPYDESLKIYKIIE